MNQAVIFEWFQKQAVTGNHRFFTVKEISKSLRDDKDFNGSHHNISILLIKLYSFGYLELRDAHSWRRSYKLKAKFIKEKKVTSPLDKDLTAEQYRDRG